MTNIARSQIVKVLSAALLVQIAFCFILSFLMPVPLIVVGFGQLIPAIIVWSMVVDYRPSLWRSFRSFGGIGLTVFACFATSSIILLCCVVVVLLDFNSHALTHLPARYPFAFLLPDMSWPVFLGFLVLFGPFIHVLNAAGEEVLWRGFLLDGLRQHFGVSQAVLMSGLAWGLWHIPMVVFLNWVFPQAFLGSLLFTAAMITWGYILSCLRIWSGSLWPPIFMHAAANAIVIGGYDSIATSASNIYTSPWGMLGILITLPIAVYLHIRLSRRKLRQ